MSDFFVQTAYLMNIALNSLPLVPEFEINPGLFEYCASQGVEGIVSCAVDSALEAKRIDEGEYKKWDERRSQIIYKNLMFQIEREKLFDEFTESGIYYMPLKGIILNDLYPAPGMRASGDNDIFFDVSKIKDMDLIMRGSGFTGDESGNSYHYIYKKKPFYMFEMHIALMKSGMEVSRKRARAIKEYYLDIKKRLIPDAGNPCFLNFTKEDFYIFHLVHAASHFNTSGMGLRFLSDTYIILKNYSESWNREYIDNVLDKFCMKDFEYMLRSLSLKLFSHCSCNIEDYGNELEGNLSEKEKSALKYISSSGTFSNHRDAVNIQMSMIHQRTDSFYGLSEIEGSFSPMVKLKYFMLYFAMMLDEVEINLISTKKSTLLIPWVLIKKTIYKLRHHSGTIKKIIS